MLQYSYLLSVDFVYIQISYPLVLVLKQKNKLDIFASFRVSKKWLQRPHSLSTNYHFPLPTTHFPPVAPSYSRIKMTCCFLHSAHTCLRCSQTAPALTTTTSLLGVPSSLPRLSIAATNSWPSTTSPNTVCFPFKCGVGT